MDLLLNMQKKNPALETQRGFFFYVGLHNCMALLNFKDWRISLGESSPSTRQRDGWARGNYPPSAGVMSRSTPSPFVMDKAKDEFGTPEHPKRKKKKNKKEN